MSIAEVSRLLESKIKSFSDPFLIIDAFDEYYEDDGSRDILLEELRRLQPPLRIFITSRPEVENLSRRFQNVAQLKIHVSDQYLDMRKYLQSEIFKRQRLIDHVHKNPTLKETIIDTIIQKADGMLVFIHSFE